MEICIRSLFANVYICIYFVTFVIQSECNDKYGVEYLFSPYLNRVSMQVRTTKSAVGSCTEILYIYKYICIVFTALHQYSNILNIPYTLSKLVWIPWLYRIYLSIRDIKIRLRSDFFLIVPLSNKNIYLQIMYIFVSIFMEAAICFPSTFMRVF